MKIHLLLFVCLIGLSVGACSSENQSSNSTDSTPSPSEPDAPPSANAVRIQYNMQVGASWATKSMETTTMTANPGTKNKAVTTLEVTMSRKFNVENIDKENAMLLKMRYLNVNVKYADANENWTYNSDDTKGRKDALGYESLVGQSLEMRINPATGQVLGVRGGENIYEALGREELSSIADDIFIAQFNQDFYVYADGPLDIGQAWTRTYNVMAPYGLKYAHTFSLEKRNNDQGFFKRMSTISPGEMPGNLYMDGRKFSLNGTGEADLNVDEKTGMIYSLIGTTLLKGSQTLPGPDGMPVTTPISVKIDLISEMSMK